MLCVPWSGGRLGGRSGTEDCRGVEVTPEVLVVGKAKDGRALTEIPEALLPGAADGPWPSIPEVMTDIAERPLAVAEMPKW